jgi:NAD(P)-dependent dehydrogenase (short-subunit alcohol dehydrogenase family)
MRLVESKGAAAQDRFRRRITTVSSVFVSGISRGIGLGVATKYLAEGHSVVGSVRSENADVAKLRSEYPDSLTVVKLDVADRSSVDAAAAEVAGIHAALDLLICSAAVNPSQAGEVAALAEIRDEDVLTTFDINVVGPLRLVRALHPLLRKGKSPKVVIISSGAGSLERTTNGGMVPYCISKAAVNMLSRRLHFLLEADGIAVLALSPGWVKTDMGGPDARISVEESAEGIARVIAAFERDSTPFQDYQGNTVPW